MRPDNNPGPSHMQTTKFRSKNSRTPNFTLNFVNNGYSQPSPDRSKYEVRARPGRKNFINKKFSKKRSPPEKEENSLFYCLQLNCHKSRTVHDNLINLLSGRVGKLWTGGGSNDLSAMVSGRGVEPLPEPTQKVGEGRGTSPTSPKSKVSRVLLLQEPCCNKDGNPPNIEGFRMLSGRANERVRACVYISNNINPLLFSQFSDADQVAVGVKLGEKTVVFASIYMPGDRQGGPVSDKLRALVEFCEEKNCQLILSSDANSHSALWNSTDTNVRGEQLAEFIIEKNLQICNRGHKPTFEVSNRREVLDITLCNGEAQRGVGGWEVSDAYTASDHNVILFTFDPSYSVPESRFRNIRKTNWESFKQYVSDKFQYVDPNSDIESKVNFLTEVLTDAFGNSTRESIKGGGSRRRGGELLE